MDVWCHDRKKDERNKGWGLREWVKTKATAKKVDRGVTKLDKCKNPLKMEKVKQSDID